MESHYPTLSTKLSEASSHASNPKRNHKRQTSLATWILVRILVATNGKVNVVYHIFEDKSELSPQSYKSMCLGAPPLNCMAKQLYFKVDIALPRYEYIIQHPRPMQDIARIWVCQLAFYPLQSIMSDIP
ncbi:hypothetical protein Pyn_13216 [Prunus yedoensis var. nudiflora]|uniref:Uncharacterized protein n=1 Tax=Prunus yedoensis var. nudiflora TaxID=2094558 RepID=A0A314Y915_PRUYE|nr:hypothetical protein Pyn_13216 [Prunus yedoensis var. nudiflora]